MAVASPDLSSRAPRPTSRPGRSAITSRPVAFESSWRPTEEGSASAPSGSAPVAFTDTYAGCATGTPQASRTRTSATAVERPSAKRVTRLGTSNRAGKPVTWTAMLSQRSWPQEFLMATRKR